MGPVTLFDKSFIEMLNVDEAALFDALFVGNICPLYFVEVLADLQLEDSGARSREKVVADLAGKTPVMRAYPNVVHTTLCLAELSGHHAVEMCGRPALGGATPVRREGKVGLYYDESREAKAFARWQQGHFQELERDFASQWRTLLRNADHGSLARLVKSTLRIHSTPRNLPDAFAIAKEVVHGSGQQFLTLKTAYTLLGLPSGDFRMIEERWKRSGYRPVVEYAPYTAHCLLVDVFFHIAVDKGLISPTRSSNRIDLAYLYYLPFAMAFVSNDKLHRRIAPLFLTENQVFIWGQELKDDLKALDEHFSRLPRSELDRGLFHFAARPPDDDRFLTTRLWKQLGMQMRSANSDLPPELVEALLQEVGKLEDAARQKVGGRFTAAEVRDAESISIQRAVPTRRGKWRLLPPNTPPGQPLASGTAPSGRPSTVK